MAAFFLPPRAATRQKSDVRKQSFLCAMDQALCVRHAQIAIAFPHATGKSLAGTLIVAWTHPGPTHQMSRVRKSAHVRPDLGDDQRGGGEIDSRNRAESM